MRAQEPQLLTCLGCRYQEIPTEDYWKAPNARRLPRGLKLGHSSRSSTTTTCFQPDTLWTLSPSEEAKKVIRKALEERHKASKNQWFFTKLGFSMRQKILIDTTNIAIDCFVIKKKKKKRRKEKSMDVQMSGQLGTKIYFFQF